MNLDSTDQALIAAAHSGDHAALLGLADKKQEEGHEDFAHLLRAGVNHGSVYYGSDSAARVRWMSGTPSAREWHAVMHLPLSGRPHGVKVSVPTHHPELREMAERLTSEKAPSGEHWLGENPLWLTTPGELTALRAAHGAGPHPLSVLHVAHGPGGLFAVYGSRSSGWNAVAHTPRGDTDGPISARPFNSREEAVAAANRLAGREPEQPEVAAQYQRALTAVSRLT